MNSLEKLVYWAFGFGKKSGFTEGFSAGKEQEKFDSVKRDLERIEYEKTIKFEILPYSRMWNLSTATHTRIRREASEKIELTEREKQNVLKCIEDDQQYYDEHKMDINPPLKISDVLGGWYCQPLKKFLTEKGYRVSSCGNNFDLWISLNDTRSNEQKKFAQQRFENNYSEFKMGLGK